MGSLLFYVFVEQYCASWLHVVRSQKMVIFPKLDNKMCHTSAKCASFATLNDYEEQV